MLSESFSHYRIRKKLGAGGMGEVYLAEDTVLERPVALKILPETFTRDEDRVRRFTGEARAVSRLNHPNIITIYEVGVEGESHYLATEYIEGETLRARTNAGPFPAAEVIAIALQMNSALGAAHALGIVHRDIKPENVMLRPDGIVKILDFGLAKFHEAAPTDGQAPTLVSRATEPGIILGTVNYMSPEQARGLPLDRRTDLWSVGVVLYELATGRLPFSGQTVTDTIVAIVNSEPISPHLINPAIDEAFAGVLLKALAKDASLRYQTANEMSDDLRALRAGTDPYSQSGAGIPFGQNTRSVKTAPSASPPVDYATQRVNSPPSASRRIPRRLFTNLGALFLFTFLVGALIYYFGYRSASEPPLNSIVVLPFVNNSRDRQSEYLGDGLTESVINRLSQIPQLRVISRNTAFHYKGRSDVQRIGRELGVGGILTGRVIEEGDTITINAELIRTEDQTQVWGNKYVLKMASMATVQDDVAASLGEKLRMTITPAGVERTNKQHQPSAAAFEAYLKGRFYWNQRTASGLQTSIEYFNKAIAADPRYALPYVGLADTYALLGSYNALPPHTSMPLARRNADAALALDDTLAEALTSRAFVKFYYDWDWAGAEADFRRALALNPNYVTAHQWYADLLVVRGRGAEAIDQARLAVAADPRSLAANGGLGVQYYFNRQPNEAIAQFQKTLADEKDFSPAILSLALALARQGRVPEAIRLLRESLDRLGNLPPLQSLLGNLEARAGNVTQARKLLDDLLARQGAGREYISAYEIAILYAGIGDRDQVFDWLDRAAEERSVYLVFLAVDPLFEAYRADGRYAALLNRLRLN